MQLIIKSSSQLAVDHETRTTPVVNYERKSSHNHTFLHQIPWQGT